ncbi:MAG TPA: glycosyltransferase [Geminicoccaceae bacterium]|nr:glycosyltransferase [Geminicoccaceae bacterium]
MEELPTAPPVHATGTPARALPITGPRPAPLAATVVHVATNLELGGAQRMLLKLVEAGVSAATTTHVVTLMPAGALGPALAATARLHSLDLARGGFSPMAAVRLASLLRQLQPDLVQGWMYHGNLAASVGLALARGLERRCARAALLWNIRGALDAPERERWLTRQIVRLGARLSGRPEAIVYNAEVAARQHEAIGYRAQRRQVIGNGFDPDRFAPDPEAKGNLRARLGLGPNSVLIGIAAEWRPMKDHATLLAAMRRLVDFGLDVDLVLLGAGTAADSPTLVHHVAANGLGGRVHGLGPTLDAAPVIAGFDIAVLASAWGEGFPNFIGEAMASGVPCVATDSGDCRRVIGAAGQVVPVRDPAALADALATLVRTSAGERVRLGRLGRERILSHYSMTAIAAEYRSLYAECIARRGVRAVPGADG